MVKRILALVLIFVCSWIAWGVLSVVMVVRTNDRGRSLSAAVGQLWGSEHSQAAPSVTVEWTDVQRRQLSDEERREYIEEKQKRANLEALRLGIQPSKVIVHGEELIRVTEERHCREVGLASSAIEVDLDLDYRKKGLLWFSTFGVAFDGRYTMTNPVDRSVEATVVVPFPSAEAVYDNMALTVPGADDLAVRVGDGRIVATFTLPGGKTQALRLVYQSRGLDRWAYRLGGDMVRSFHLAMRTDFDRIDFPPGSISPDGMTRRADGHGWELVWDKESMVSGLDMGMAMPHRLNPGPLASAMSQHAPVSLFFFFFVLFVLQVLRGIRLHPMNYFFLAASFFAFNLLFSYLVDHVDIRLSFVISSAVSIFLVVSYLRLCVGTRFAVVEAGAAQLVYQVLFSLAHFFEGYTGLTITIGAVLTLAVIMRLTARLDWEEVFERGPTARPAPPPLAG